MRLLAISILLILSSCSIEKKLSKSAKENVLNNKALVAAHVGISVYEPATGKYWYDYQGDKYFVPASNTKIPTCYAAMKYLGDSLVGLRFAVGGGRGESLVIQGTGDPTFLHSDFRIQPVYNFIKTVSERGIDLDFSVSNWKEQHWGSGWAWNDYDESYMAERSPFPIYGNVVKFSLKGNRVKAIPSAFDGAIVYRAGALNDSVQLDKVLGRNEFDITKSNNRFRDREIPFSTEGYTVPVLLLNDTIRPKHAIGKIPDYRIDSKYSGTIYSQPTDSLLKPMMHRSDNFFAEQSLLMVSNERLGVMSDAQIIDTLLKSDFKDLPQKPRWADGSGLSRYNLFTPQDFVAILNKMKNEFGMDRIKVILPTGGEGTISSYYKNETGYIYGKTGTLSGVVAFSGFLYTKKGKLLIFSTLVNNHQASATDIRRAMEKFLVGLRNNY